MTDFLHLITTFERELCTGYIIKIDLYYKKGGKKLIEEIKWSEK